VVGIYLLLKTVVSYTSKVIFKRVNFEMITTKRNMIIKRIHQFGNRSHADFISRHFHKEKSSRVGEEILQELEKVWKSGKPPEKFNFSRDIFDKHVVSFNQKLVT
jgi:hypothetical protein